MKKRVLWKAIPGYEGMYTISTNGEIKSLSRKGAPQVTILKPSVTKNGYNVVNLADGVSKKTYNVHTLMAVTYLDYHSGNRRIVCDHINSVKTDNKLENIHLVSARYNSTKDRIGKGTSKYPGVSWNTKNEKWVSAIEVNNKSIYLGSFDDEIEAALSYTVALELTILLVDTDQFREKVNSIISEMSQPKSSNNNPDLSSL